MDIYIYIQWIGFLGKIDRKPWLLRRLPIKKPFNMGFFRFQCSKPMIDPLLVSNMATWNLRWGPDLEGKALEPPGGMNQAVALPKFVVVPSGCKLRRDVVTSRVEGLKIVPATCGIDVCVCVF